MKTFAWFGMVCVWLVSAACGQAPESLRNERDVLVQRGLWRDALMFYREKLMPLSDARSGEDLTKAIESLQRLADWAVFDEVVETAVAGHAENPHVLQAAAGGYQMAPKQGRMVGGEFQRGQAGELYTEYRDRVRSLQLIVESLKHAPDDPLKNSAWRQIAAAFDTGESWKLQILTPLDALPEWDEPGPSGGTEGAPWAKDGPVLYHVPESWQAAKNDGERWRFALAELAKFSLVEAARTAFQRASFSQTQFGSETLADYGWWQQRDPEREKGMLAVDTLAEDEVLARTSDGVRRFKLPAEHHFIALYRSILDSKEFGAQAGDALARVFLNRRQFVKAREVLEQMIAKHGEGPEKWRRELLKQITGNWGRFGPAETVPEGKRPLIPLVFRNAVSVQFTAAPVDMDAVLADTIAYLNGNPRELDWDRINPSAIASRIIAEKKSKFVGEVAASWDQALKPEAEHRDSRAEVEVPLDKAGAWWITAEIGDGNIFSTLVWITDNVLVQRDVAGNKQWWTADAASGAPIPASEIEFFGYRVEHRENRKPLERRMDVLVKSFTRTTDGDGKILIKPGDMEPGYEWMAIGRKQDRAAAFFGFQPFSIEPPRFENGNRDLSYGITDRPLYKPGDPLHVKFFLRNVGYFEPEEGKFANRVGTLTLFNGRGEEALKIADLKTDELGAVEAETLIPKDAPLGNWRAVFSIPDVFSSSVSFQVEEFRKPEFEVTVEAPAEPVKLGDKFTATVKALYFHGAPVREAEVEVIVKRASLGERWFPAGRWDWLYGKGAWWPGVGIDWHPGWRAWSCMPPDPRWRDRWTPEEVVMRRTLRIGRDGTAKLEVDTAAAREIHGDLDAEYSIEARVVDASRREEKGSGKVIAARKPFEVVVWPDRGFTKPGEEVSASISVATLAGKPGEGAEGTLKLFKMSVGDGGKVEEKEAGSWPVKTDAEGKVTQRFAVAEAGQYRLAASVSLNGGMSEGATILNVHGVGKSEAAEWKFGPLELIADKLEYAAGDVMKLRVNSDKPDAHVWLFLHIGGSSGREARRIQLDGKSREIEVALDRRDMPNMFVEAVTVFDAEIRSAFREILLPPESRLIEVTVEPAKAKVGPRERSDLKITLKDAAGMPVTGKAVLAVYDKALEAITGGSNIMPIHEQFWKWKNSYNEGGSECSVPTSPGNLTRPKVKGMETLEHEGGGPWGSALGIVTAGLRSGDQAINRNTTDAVLGSPQPAATAAMSKEIDSSPDAVPVLVRKDFADLLKWVGTIAADENGVAIVPLEFPDNLTTWKARVWVLGTGTRVGEGSTEIITSKDLLVRLQAPRFLVERDEAVLSAVVHNDHAVAKTVSVSMELDGGFLKLIEGKTKSVEIAARSEWRVDWRVKAVREGVAKIRVKVIADGDGDAVERDLPVRVHGMMRQDAWSRVVEPDAPSTKISIEVPEKLRPEETKLTVRVSPTIAGAVVDAIPYLASYPHGCTEQTLNRFIPSVIAARMLKDMNINLADVKAKRTNLNPQELGNADARAAEWKQWKENPVFDERELGKMVKVGMEKLAAMQNRDGGWGWFSGYGEQSYPHTTAVVVHGLLIGNAADLKVDGKILERGLNWLAGHEKQQIEALKRHAERAAAIKAGKNPKPSRKLEKAKADALDAFIRETLGRAGSENREMLDFLYRDRIDLPVYGQALLGLELHRLREVARRDEVMAVTSQFLQRDAENQTVYLDLKNGGYWWNWYGSGVEAHSWYLKLLTAVKPNDPDTRGLVKYLLNNRKGGNYWESTRDTAYVIEAIAGYAKASGEDAPEMEIEVLIDGKSQGKTSINRDNLFSFDGTTVLQGKSISPGKHDIEIRRTGKGAVYANAYLEVFTLEDRLRAAGLEIKVERKISKVVTLDKESQVPDDTGLVVKQTEERVKKEALADGAAVKSGDRIEVELILESKNDYEYLIFSDAKAAGFEALDALSGYVRGSGLSAYMEPRDRTVDFFIRSLPRGTHTLRYQLRAEAPGIYKALPATASAMYAPELRGNSADFRLEVR